MISVCLKRVRFTSTRKIAFTDFFFENLDSLAGQMSALKSGGVSGLAAPPKRPRKRGPVESSDEESDTEGEAEDTSETDTETEDES